jgi:hypothetical protein
MRTLFLTGAAKKAFSEISQVLAGTATQATVQVTPETSPVLEFFLEQAHMRMQKGGL